MAGEALLIWEEFVTHPVFKRYAKYAKDPAALFDCIGEDLGTSNQEVREIAFWALVWAMPELMSILHERETRQPGWRDIEGKDQRMMNRASNIVSDLHRQLVKEHQFKIGGRYGKDPRPYVKKAIKNRKIDEGIKREREVLLDYQDTLKIPDPTPSIEDSVLEKIANEERKRELRDWGFLSEQELDLVETICIDERPLEEVRERLGVTSQVALRQRLSRVRKNIVAERDALFTYLLIGGEGFPKKGVVMGGFDNLEKHKWWVERAKRSVQPGVWLGGMGADGKNAMAVRPLTRGFRNVPAHIYLVAIHKDYLCKLYLETYYRSKERVERLWHDCDLLTLDTQRCLKIVDKMIDPKSTVLQQSRYMYSMIDAYPTELPGINESLTEIRDDYMTWLISNSVPDYHHLGRWRPEDELLKRQIRMVKLHQARGPNPFRTVTINIKPRPPHLGFDLHKRISQILRQSK